MSELNYNEILDFNLITKKKVKYLLMSHLKLKIREWINETHCVIRAQKS